MGPQHILFAGCGDLGGAAARLLLARGASVSALRRTVSKLPPGVHGIAGDLVSGRGFDAIPSKLDAVVYIVTAASANEQAYWEAYVGGLQRLLEHPGVASARRLVFVSSTSVYAQRDGEQVDETSPTLPTRYNGQIMLAAEGVAAQHPHATILRLGGIYGRGRERLIRWVREGRACVEDPPHFTNRIHRDDAARAIAHLLDLPSPQAVYVGVDHDPAAQHLVLDWIADQLMLARVPRDESARSALGSKRCVNRALVASAFQFNFSTYRDGYAPLLAAQP
jgi:nucleoside-diphosphate-sugar epimerase